MTNLKALDSRRGGLQEAKQWHRKEKNAKVKSKLKRSDLDISYSNVCHTLRRMGFKRLLPRSWLCQQDAEKMIAFKEELFLLRKEPDVEIWYQDECGVLGDSRPRLVWYRKGKRPILPFTGAHFKDNVIGAVRPADGKFFSLIMPTSNTRSFQIFLDETQRHVHSRRAVMILDNASWHKPKMLDWGAYSRFTFLLTRLISIPSNASG